MDLLRKSDDRAITASPPSLSSTLPPYDSEAAEVHQATYPNDHDTAFVETGGIERVRTADGDGAQDLHPLHALLVWLSCNLTAENVILAMLGPVQYHLSFLDAVLYGIGGAAVGSIPVAFVATFGPRTGHRTMVISRYSMGWLPAKAIALLNIVVLLGYLVIDAVTAGQIISAISSSGSLSVVVGIIIAICLTGIVSTVGIKLFQVIEQYAWIAQLAAMCVLAGTAVPKFNMTSSKESLLGLDRDAVIASRVSFFSLCLAGSITYAPCAADMFVYLPRRTNGYNLFFQTLLGLTMSFTLTFLIGVGLASGSLTTPAWNAAYDESPGSLIAQALLPLGSLGTVTGVVLSLGIVANMMVSSYSISFSLQAVGSRFATIPRPICSLAGIIVCAVCAVWGRAFLAAILTNFVSFMGYWVVIWIAILGEEHFIFRSYLGLGYNWTLCDASNHLPPGLASTVSFLLGWVGAILCMSQTWFVGPVAALIGPDGADIASFVGFALSALSFPLLRLIEHKVYKR